MLAATALSRLSKVRNWHRSMAAAASVRQLVANDLSSLLGRVYMPRDCFSSSAQKLNPRCPSPPALCGDRFGHHGPSIELPDLEPDL
jgi:hypothetical protein